MGATTDKIERDNPEVETEDPHSERLETTTPIDWKRVSELRVTKKVIEALSNLEIEGLYLVPANRRKDARKKYLGYGSRKMLVEAEVPFGFNGQQTFTKIIGKEPEALNQYKEECAKIIEQALFKNETVIQEDTFGLIQMAMGIHLDGEPIGIFRVGGFVSGKSDDLMIAKISEKVGHYVRGKNLSTELKSLKFFSSEKIAVISNLLSMLADEIGAYLKETVNETKTATEVDKFNYHGLITKNPTILEIIRQIKLIGNSQSSVIIYGESGTGKELVANLIHRHSPRSDKPFVTINCAALTETILEAELFGYKKGAFTGATTDKSGLFEVADKGTVFLDEVGEMSLSLQVKILRLIQEGTFMRVADTQTRKVDVQVISATHRDLRKMIELGKFREDLYYRLAVVELTLPPLRERSEDVPILVSHFVNYFLKKTNKNGITLSAETMKIFVEYYWPGNVREMRNEIERLIALSSSQSMLKPSDLSKKFFYETYPEGLDIEDEEEEGFIKKMVDDFERNLLSKYLRKHKWNKTKVARLCGITRQGLNKKISKYKLDRRRA
ncbi:MAG: sigma 54-interacting transcriptional regulator [Bdellovibrionales bacterium]|nr:sigma 54-interacting transcriptional regulator [Bdellovibrionales bacterium]